MTTRMKKPHLNLVILFCLVVLCSVPFWYFVSTLHLRSLIIDQMIIFTIALVLDLTLGDPPERIEKYYPIVWISKVMVFFDRITKRGDARKEQILGVLDALLIISLFSVPCFMLPLLPELVYIILGSLIFTMTFTIKGLERYERNVVKAEELNAKRAAVAKIVSREVTELDNEQLNSAAIESVAENLTDSVIAPFFYFSLFGVFGAMVYRVINTLDAVVGYKAERYLHFGWFSAKADDMLNYIPERISAALILVVNNITLRDVRLNEKGTAHLTIVAMSYALNVKLEKKGHYTIGEQFKSPDEKHIEEAMRIMKRCSLLLASAYIGVMVILHILFSAASPSSLLLLPLSLHNQPALALLASSFLVQTRPK
jgi:adenosylcobinamide-phosphate synthase